jgi:hypothetical protein
LNFQQKTKTRADQYFAAVGDASAKLDPQSYVKMVANTQFNRQLEELTGQYVTLEDFYLRRSFQKVQIGVHILSIQLFNFSFNMQAVKINALTPDGKTTTIVDDTFFILQLCAE